MAAAIEMATKDREYITKYQSEVGHISSEYMTQVRNIRKKVTNSQRE